MSYKKKSGAAKVSKHFGLCETGVCLRETNHDHLYIGFAGCRDRESVAGRGESQDRVSNLASLF